MPKSRLARPVALTMIAAGLCLSPTAVAAQEQARPPAANVVVAAPTANINITPRRVVFDPLKRTESVYVFNQGTAPVTVDVTLIDNVMLPSGEILPLEKLAQRTAAEQAVGASLRSARDLILASPSRLILAPGKGRTIRLRADLGSATDAAELRTHLAVTTVPTADAGLTAETAAAARPGELAFRIQSVFGVSIPLILRQGPVDAAATISDLKIETIDAPFGPAGELRRGPVLTFSLNRTGASSIFGNIEARSNSGKTNEIIGFIRGLAVYPEIGGRRVAMPLSRLPQSGEKLSVTFVSDDPQLGKLRANGTMIVP